MVVAVVVGAGAGAVAVAVAIVVAVVAEVVEVAEAVVVVMVELTGMLADVQAVPTHLLLTLLTDYLRAGGAQAEKPRQVSAPARQHGCKVPDPLSRQP